MTVDKKSCGDSNQEFIETFHIPVPNSKLVFCTTPGDANSTVTPESLKETIEQFNCTTSAVLDPKCNQKMDLMQVATNLAKFENMIDELHGSKECPNPGEGKKNKKKAAKMKLYEKHFSTNELRAVKIALEIDDLVID